MNRKFMSWTDGKKTYMAAGLLVVAGALQAFHIAVPEWLFAILGGSAFIAHRAAITKIAYAIQWDKIAVNEILNTVSEKK